MAFEATISLNKLPGSLDSLPACLVNEHAAAEILGLKVSTLRRWRWSGSPVPFVRVGKAVRYDLRDLGAFIDGGKCRSTSDHGPGGEAA